MGDVGCAAFAGLGGVELEGIDKGLFIAWGELLGLCFGGF